MRIVDLIDKRSVELNGKPSDKTDIINQMVDLMYKSEKISDKEIYKIGVFQREELGTTGVGEGIAIPHAKSDAVIKPGLAAMVIKDGTDFDSLDGEKVDLIFLIAAPDTEENVHLGVLSKLSTLLMDKEFVENLKNSKTVDEFLSIIDETEKKKDEEEIRREKEVVKPKEKQKIILGVTGCPTGIAHTYMAAEALQQAAEKKGAFIKVETRGSGGVKSELTSEEIKNADFIIVAADTKVPMDRFDGKKLIERQVSDGINKAEELVDMAIAGEGKIYKAREKLEKSDAGDKETGGRAHRIYTHLMNGISHMLPFVVGGGILIAIAFLIDGLSVDLASLPDNAKEAALLGVEHIKGDFGTITPLAAFFKNAGDLAFGFMLPVLAGYISLSIADRPGLAVGFVGGALAANGTSGFLGALIAGFLAGYLVNGLKKLFSKLPDSLEGLKPVLLYPVFGLLLIALLMTYVVEPPVGALNNMLNNALSNMSGTSSVLLGAIVAGMMAVDMGGPVNKAAYVFGSASIAEGHYGIMAAVMIGGMVPPIAIALAALLFKHKFTENEKKAAPANFIMGLSFITEGAIPFAAADPLRVLPACIGGSAVAGALSMAFDCTLMAPHGGIFVFPVVGNPVKYIISLVVGSIVGALLLGLLKKNVNEVKVSK